jgi:HEAT repeat protein
MKRTSKFREKAKKAWEKMKKPFRNTALMLSFIGALAGCEDQAKRNIKPYSCQDYYSKAYCEMKETLDNGEQELEKIKQAEQAMRLKLSIEQEEAKRYAEYTRKVSNIKKLGKRGDTNSIKRLIEALKAEDRNIRKITFNIISNLENKENSILLLLKDEDENIRKFAFELLENVQNKKALIPSLLKTMQIEDKGQSKMLADILNKEGENVSLSVLFRCFKSPVEVVYQGAAEQLEKRGRPAVVRLVRLLGYKDNSVADFAKDTLVRMGKVAVPSLMRSIRSKDLSRQIRSINALAEIKDPRSIIPLVNLLKTKNVVVRSTVVKALVSIGKPAIAPLVESLKSKNPRVRLAAAQALGQMSDKDEVERWMRYRNEKPVKK